ncbi:hypothetical protein WJX81_002556 [Elliptochloris bilobata]|uniref:Inositol polyphosphate multikinase n=1 Tax=Elliptochloris bilobata TaxID=381761 RepID=A0AAW1QLU7_9CHLO
MSTVFERAKEELTLRPCKHQVAGHLFEEGKAGSLVDDAGHFYKPLQGGPRGRREREFYERIQGEVAAEAAERLVSCANGTVGAAAGDAGVSGSRRKSWDGEPDRRQRAPFTARNAMLLRAIPTFLGVVEAGGRQLVALEDVARHYRRPSICDIKVGFRTWYPNGDAAYIQRCQLKDAATTQSTLGFKICGMQVYRQCQRGYWRASKRWCKELPPEGVNKALLRFANNEAGLRPADIYGGVRGAIAQLRDLEAWFQEQREFYFYSSSVLLIYEGDVADAADARLSVRLVDFAHTFASDGKKDANFLAGLRALIKALQGVVRMDFHDSLM